MAQANAAVAPVAEPEDIAPEVAQLRALTENLERALAIEDEARRTLLAAIARIERNGEVLRRQAQG